MITIEVKDVTQDLTISELVLLKCICENDKELFEVVVSKIDGVFMFYQPLSTICSLQEKLYIKILNDTFEGLILREKGEKFKSNVVAVDFEEFWKKYHKVTKLKATDKAEAQKFFKRLKKQEIQAAMDNIEAYFESTYNGKGTYYPRKAKYYLEYKLFNDEFKQINVSKTGSIFSLAGEN